jgi:hypothetical protein
MSNPHEETAAKLINPYGFQHVAQQPICPVPNFILFYIYLIDHQTVTNLNTIQILIFFSQRVDQSSSFPFQNASADSKVSSFIIWTR